MLSGVAAVPQLGTRTRLSFHNEAQHQLHVQFAPDAAHLALLVQGRPRLKPPYPANTGL